MIMNVMPARFYPRNFTCVPGTPPNLEDAEPYLGMESEGEEWTDRQVARRRCAVSMSMSQRASLPASWCSLRAATGGNNWCAAPNVAPSDALERLRRPSEGVQSPPEARGSGLVPAKHGKLAACTGSSMGATHHTTKVPFSLHCSLDPDL
jgi:hypothetical protein